MMAMKPLSVTFPNTDIQITITDDKGLVTQEAGCTALIPKELLIFLSNCTEEESRALTAMLTSDREKLRASIEKLIDQQEDQEKGGYIVSAGTRGTSSSTVQDYSTQWENYYKEAMRNMERLRAKTQAEAIEDIETYNSQHHQQD